jgi:hypothetical protein
MYIKNRNGRNYEGLLKIGFCKLLGVQATLRVKEEIIAIFNWLVRSFHHSVLFTALCSCHCSNHHSLRKINDLERLNKLDTIIHVQNREAWFVLPKYLIGILDRNPVS